MDDSDEWFCCSRLIDAKCSYYINKFNGPQLTVVMTVAETTDQLVVLINRKILISKHFDIKNGFRQFQAKVNAIQIQVPLKLQDFLFSFVINNNKLKNFGFWTTGTTEQGI